MYLSFVKTHISHTHSRIIILPQDAIERMFEISASDEDQLWVFDAESMAWERKHAGPGGRRWTTNIEIMIDYHSGKISLTSSRYHRKSCNSRRQRIIPQHKARNCIPSIVADFPPADAKDDFVGLESRWFAECKK